MTSIPLVLRNADSRKKRPRSATFAFLGLLFCLVRPATAQLVESFGIDGGGPRFVYQVFEYPDAEGKLRSWVATSSGVLREQQSSFQERSDPKVKVHRIAAFGDRLWFATAHGLRPQDWTPAGEPRPEPGAPFTTLASTTETLWAGGQDRLVYVLRDGNRRSIEVAGKVNAIVPVDSTPAGPKSLWFSTTSGIFLIDLPSSLPNAKPAALAVTEIVRGPRLELIDLAARTDRAWAVESYKGPRGTQIFMQLHEVRTGRAPVLGPAVKDRLVTVDRLRGDELWITREEAGGLFRVFAGRIDPASDDLRFTPVDVPFDVLDIGKPKRILADSTRDGGVWLWSTTGLFRGQGRDASSWAEVRLPGRNLAAAHFVQGGSQHGVLWLSYPADGLLRLHPDAELTFHLGFENFAIIPAVLIPTKYLGFEKNWLLSSRGPLQIIGCRYQGATGPLAEVAGCRSFKRTLVGDRESRRRALEDWQVGKKVPQDAPRGAAADRSAAIPGDHILKPLPGLFPVAFAGIADRHGNQRSLDYVVTYIGWKQLLFLLLVLSMTVWTRARGFVFSILEVLFGTRIGIVALRIPGLRWPYLRRYLHGAWAKLADASADRLVPARWSVPDRLEDALQEGTCCVVSTPQDSLAEPSPIIEEWALRGNHSNAAEARPESNANERPRRRPLLGLLPMRVDFGSETDVEAIIIKRLKSLGGMEKRIAEFIWEHADFLFILSSVAGWEEGKDGEQGTIERLLSFIRLQSEDVDARFVVIADPAEASALEPMLARVLHRVELIPTAETVALPNDEAGPEDGEPAARGDSGPAAPT